MMSIILQFVGVIVLGGFGGLLQHMRQNKGALVTPQKAVHAKSKQVSYRLGFLEQMMYGVGAALMAFLSLDTELPSMFRVVGIAFAASFLGYKYLEKSVQAQLKQSSKEDKHDNEKVQ